MNHSKRNNQNQNIMLLPIIAVLGFIPLIVHMIQYDSGMDSYVWFPAGTSQRVDLFLAWKGVAVMVAAGIMLVILIVQAAKKKPSVRMENAFYLLLVYAVFALMSALFSPYKPQVFTGAYEIFQPIGVLLGYLVICFYTYQCIDTGTKLNRVLLFSSIGFGILLVIGVSQAAGLDLLQTAAGKFIISDAFHKDKLDTINFTMPKYTVYATLYNPDFLSFYFGLLIPVVMASFLSVKKIWQKIVLGTTLAGCFICLIGAGAAAGYLAFGIAAAAGLFILLSRNRKVFRIGAAVAAVAATMAVIVCLATPAGEKMLHLFLGTQRSIDSRAVKSIETEDDGVYFDVNGTTLRIAYGYDEDSGQLTAVFYDKDGAVLPSETVVNDDGAVFELEDSSYPKCQAEPVMLDDTLSICVSMDGIDWYFSNQTGDEDGGYYYYNPFGRWEKIQEVKKSRLFRDDAMSNRGNIWNLTIPQLPEHILLGSGTNTFGFVFPQNDYVYKVYQGQPNVLTVKAHNWYLQEWVENGLPALLCLLGFYLWYFVRSLNIYRHCNMESSTAKLGFGIFVGTIGYMAAGMASDSNVCTAPVFWVMMGLGMAVNRMIAEKEGLERTAAVKTDTAPPVPETADARSTSGKKSGKKLSHRERKNSGKKK